MIIDQVQHLRKPSLLKPNYQQKREALKKPLLVFSFDDITSSDYTFAFPLMQSMGIKGTSYVITDFVGKPSYLTWAQVAEMKSAGWDFQCHTNKHGNVSDMTEAELRADMEAVNAAFIAHGIEPPKHHAYPRGLTNDVAKTIMEDYRLTQRLTGIDARHLNDYKTIDASALKAISVDTQDDSRFNLVKSSINTGVNERKIIILYCHRIVPSADGYEYQVLESYFTQILEHIKMLGVETLTISEMYDRVFSS